MRQRFNVVIPKDDGGIEIYPMKQWLRQNPQHLPADLDPTASTSHELRNALKKRGWSIQSTESEVRLLMPGAPVVETDIERVLGGENDDENEEEVQGETAFALEYQLRDFIAQNFNSIAVDKAKLRLYVDPAGQDGIEYPTDVGRIDILAVDDAGAFVVFELKRAKSPDHAIGQLARYMGWVKQTIGKGKKVRGVIVAKSISDSLRYAVDVVPDVSLCEYEVSFKLNVISGFSKE